MGEVVDIDPQARRVVLGDGATYEYDSLIIATGSETNYFGHDNWRDVAPSLKSVEESTMIRHKILYAFEAAERSHDPAERRAWLTFIIVGGGATGVELAGALAEIAHQTLKHDFRAIRPEESHILLLDGSPRVLSALPDDLSQHAEKSLVRLGVRTRNKVMVQEIDPCGLTFKTQDGHLERIETRTVLWAGGVRIPEFGRKLAQRTNAPTDRQGRIRVNPDLTIPGFPDIFVVGDLAETIGKDGKPLPGVAQVAIQGGRYAARTIRARVDGKPAPEPFKYFDKGDLAVIGRNSAVAHVFGVHLWGWPAWIVWLFVHLMYLVEYESRLLVFIQWGIQYLTFSRGARLITGAAKMPECDISGPEAQPVSSESRR
jgi:NADH dehydrogenase